MKFNFADYYSQAGLQPTAEIIASRQAAFSRIRKLRGLDKVMDLVRVYFGIQTAPEWFVAEFAKDDAAFSVVGNEREAIVLAAIHIAAALDDGRYTLALTVLTTAFAGTRAPTYLPDLVSAAKAMLDRQAISDRTLVKIDPDKAKAGFGLELEDAISELPGNDWEALKGLLGKLEERSVSLAQQAVQKLVSTVQVLEKQNAHLREEVDIQWWLLGETSQALGVQYGDLDAAKGALLAGYEIGQLSSMPIGPVAAPSLIWKMAKNAKKPKSDKTKLSELVDSMSEDQLLKISTTELVGRNPQIFPVLFSISKAREIGSGSWHALYKRETGLDAAIEISLQDLSIQVYREVMLARTL